MTQSELNTLIRRWKNNTRLAVRELFNITPDAWQDECFDDINANNPNPKSRRQGMQACKNPGKTFTLAAEAWVYAVTRPHSVIPAISITKDNLRDNLWTELARLQARSPLLKKMFTWKAERITCNLSPATWFFTARAYSKSANDAELRQALAGTHADYVFFLIDEGGGIPPAVLTTAEAALGSGKETRLSIAGNCTSRAGALYHACVKHAHNYSVHRITGDPDNPKRAPRVDIGWARQMIEDYGRDWPWVKADVLGEWPDSDINTIISEDLVIEAQTRDLKASMYDWCDKRLAVDVAFDGGDLNVFQPRQGMCFFDPETMAITPNTKNFIGQIAGRVLDINHRWHYEREYIDCTGGYGQGVVEELEHAGRSPYRYNGAEGASSPQFYNKVSECYFNLVTLIKQGASLPDIPQLVPELSLRTYSSIHGRWAIEPKKDFKSRVLNGRSPNYADACAIACSEPSRPATDQLAKYLKSQAAEREVSTKRYDPYRRFKEKNKRR